MKLINNERDWFESEMTVKEAMTRMPFTVAPEVSIFDVKNVMKERGVRHLPVLQNGELAGVISDRDIQTAETFHGRGYLKVRDAMTDAPYAVHPDTPLCEVLGNMIDKKIGSALVKSSRGVVIGIFTAHDALQLLRALVLIGSREREASEPTAITGPAQASAA